MKTRKKQPTFLLATLLILNGLACNAVTTLSTTPTPTAIPSTSTALPPTSTSIPPTPTSTPIVDCAKELSDILATVKPNGNAAQELRGRPDGEVKNELYPVSIYQVNGENIKWTEDIPVPDNLASLQEQKDVHQKIWDFYISLIPKDQRSMIGEFVIVTDGEDKLLAAVRQTDSNLYRWVLEVDVADIANSKGLTYTLIHEFAHLLTLNFRQVTPSEPIFENPGDQQVYSHEALRCDQYFMSEGCSQPNSYLNSFYKDFWADIYPEWEQGQSGDREQYYENLNNFYQKYQDRFITDYAVVNPVEDIAESFSFFILSPKPTGDTIAEEKVLFFHNYPELVALRDEIQNRICSVNP